MSSVDLWKPSHTHCSLVRSCEAQGWICSHFPKWSLTPLYSFHERCHNTLDISACLFFFFPFFYFLLLPGRTKVPILRKGFCIMWPFLGNCGEANVINETVRAGSVTQSCPTLCDPMDCSPQGFSVCGISQARILQWVAFPFSWGSSKPRDRPGFGTPHLLHLLHWQAYSLLWSHLGSPHNENVLFFSSKTSCLWEPCRGQGSSDFHENEYYKGDVLVAKSQGFCLG